MGLNFNRFIQKKFTVSSPQGDNLPYAQDDTRQLVTQYSLVISRQEETEGYANSETERVIQESFPNTGRLWQRRSNSV